LLLEKFLEFAMMMNLFIFICLKGKGKRLLFQVKEEPEECVNEKEILL